MDSLFSSPKMHELPQGSWDAHCHVFDPERFPFIDDTPYTPPQYSVSQLIQDSMNDNHVIVMGVPEGTDCRNILDAIATHRTIKGDARGVAVLSQEQLRDTEYLHQLHNAGVRSVRLHEARLRLLLSKRDLESRDLMDAFTETAQLIHAAQLEWSIEAQLDLALWAELGPTIRDLHRRYGTKVVVDHTFNMAPGDEKETAFQVALETLREGSMWVKLSGLSRFSPDPAALTPILDVIIRTRPDRVLWGSDAPHVVTSGDTTRFSAVDVKIHLEILHGICAGQAGWWDMLVKSNAEGLYQ